MVPPRPNRRREKRFSEYWARVTLPHFDSAPLEGAFKVMARYSPLAVIKAAGMLWKLAGRESGDLEVESGTGPNTADVILVRIPGELLRVGYFVGFQAAWRAVLIKGKAQDIRMSRTEQGTTYRYHCAWK